jgi:hypothetical protein
MLASSGSVSWRILREASLMKVILAVVVVLLGLLSVAHAEGAVDCSGKRPSETENFNEWSAYRNECELDCKNTLAIYCEKHAHVEHKHVPDILTQKRIDEAKEMARIRREKNEEANRWRRERRAREATLEAIVRRMPRGIERR